jgi:BlaI family penicillinase repressor
MARKGEPPLSRREREIMDIIYARGEATAIEVVAGLADPPTKTAVRTLLKILEDKGHLTHRVAGQTFIFRPSRPRTHAGKSALRRVLDVFFGGSLEQAVAVHLGDSTTELSPDELKKLATLIQKARQKGK